MIRLMTSSRIALIHRFLLGLMLWLTIACAAPAPAPTASNPARTARLYTRTPTPTVTATPTLDPQVLYQQGLIQRDAWDLDVALDRFDTVLTLTPSAVVYASRAELHRLAGRYEEAVADIERALDLAPTLVAAWWQKALVSRSEGAWDEALSAVNKLIELEPEDGAAYALRAQIQVEGFGDILAALGDYNRAIARDPVFDKATLVERWHIFARLGKWRESLLISYKMINTGSEDPLRSFYRGWPLIQLGQLDAAIQVLSNGIRRYPDNSLMLYYALGVAYHERQAWFEAIQALEVALIQLDAQPSQSAPERPLDITSAEILGRMGIAYLELKQCETGAAILERAIAESPDSLTLVSALEQVETCYTSLTPTPTPGDIQAP
jgi:tetratricopeptide (TPR) repeat protein